MQEFIVNEYLKLQLEGTQTNIYVNDKRFLKCKYLMISIPHDEVGEWDHYKTMDEIIKASGKEEDKKATTLAPEEEFKGHCSNIQAWVENGYDTAILDTRLSIPIIKEILVGLLENHNKEKAYVYPKDYWKQKFKRFFSDVVESLNDYFERSRKNVYTFGKFKFLHNVVFREKDIFFEPQEIAGSLLLREFYNRFIEKVRIDNIRRKRNYWERKLWKKEPVVEKDSRYYVGWRFFYYKKDAELYSKRKNMAYRKFLRNIRSSDQLNRKITSVSDKRDYLPYLYSMGKFTNEKNISFMKIDGEIYIRDSNGWYWTEEGNEWKGF